MDTDPTKPLSEEDWTHLLAWAEEAQYYIEDDDHINDIYYDPDLGREDKTL